MIELAFAPPERAKVFDCSSCPEQTKSLRRCASPREDFTYQDHGSVFPIMVTQTGTQFGFCPAKAGWDPAVRNLFQTLMIAAETGNLWNSGGISDQPAWFIDLFGPFLMRYNDHKFFSRAEAVLGKAGSTTPKASPNRKGK